MMEVRVNARLSIPIHDGGFPSQACILSYGLLVKDLTASETESTKLQTSNYQQNVIKRECKSSNADHYFSSSDNPEPRANHLSILGVKRQEIQGIQGLSVQVHNSTYTNAKNINPFAVALFTSFIISLASVSISSINPQFNFFELISETNNVSLLRSY